MTAVVTYAVARSGSSSSATWRLSSADNLGEELLANATCRSQRSEHGVALPEWRVSRSPIGGRQRAGGMRRPFPEVRERRASGARGSMRSALWCSCRRRQTTGDPMAYRDEIYRAADEQSIVLAARALMAADENAALVTVDADGQPRVRSVRAFLEDLDLADLRRSMTVWVMTRHSTRKVEQLRRNPKATLYFDDDAELSYLSIMGVAVVHTDPAVVATKPFYDDGHASFFWPKFPHDFVVLEIQPHWIEFMGPGIPNHAEHWRPQGLDLGPVTHSPRRIGP